MANIGEIIKRLDKEYKDEGIATIGSSEPEVDRIKLPSLELNYITGGGIPIGRWTRLYGQSRAGKSKTVWWTIAEAQRMGMTVAYVNAEKQYTPQFAELHGVDNDNLLVLNTTVIEKIGEIVESILPEVDLVAIDSCTSTITETELADGLNEKEYRAIRARRWAQQFAFIQERFDHHRNTIMLVDQIRDNMSMAGGMKAPGGRYMEFISSMTLEYRMGGWLFMRDGVLSDTAPTNQPTMSGGQEADGYQMQVRCVKSRVCRPFRQARLNIDLATHEHDAIEEFWKAAKHFDVVEKNGSWYKYPPGAEKSIRKEDFRKMLREDSDLRDKIEEIVLSR